MSCPSEIADIILEILQVGLLRIRAAAWASDFPRCELEADHLHNLPDLMKNYSTERLQYYWEAERTSFIEKGSRTVFYDPVYENLWERLRPFVKSLPQSALAELPRKDRARNSNQLSPILFHPASAPSALSLLRIADSRPVQAALRACVKKPA
jgi:hypothetical protein